MKNFSRQPVWALFVVLAFVASCSRQDLVPISVTDPRISIAEAKEWVSDYVQQRDNLNQPFSKFSFRWQQATLKRTEQGINYVQVELDQGKLARRVQYDATKKIFVEAPKLQGLIFTDAQGNKQLQIMELAPTNEYTFSHQGFTDEKDYSGMQLLLSWKGKLIKGYRFENGKITGFLSEIAGSNPKARQQGCETWARQDLYIGCTNYRNEATAVGTTLYYPTSSPVPFPPLPHFSDPSSYKSCNSNWQLNGPPQFFQICSSYSDPSNPYNPYNPNIPNNPSDLFNPTPGSGLTPLLELQNNKIGLYGPCPGLDGWRRSLDFKTPPVITDKLARLSKYPAFSQPNPYSLPNDWYVQSIRNSAGSAVNLDNFSVFMEDLPTVNGQRLSINEFASYVRTNINSFVNTNLSRFSTHGGTGENEADIWQSNSPLGAVISIAIPGDDGVLRDNGSVIVSEVYNGYESAGWTFSTIHDPWNGDHPVSGTRIFGCYETAGGYIFYTQGADRLTNYFGSLVGFTSKQYFGQEFQFKQADQLWMSFQTKIAEFVSGHGVNNFQILQPDVKRPKWDKLKEALDNNRSLSTVPCN